MITGIMLGILVFQLLLFMSFCSVQNMNDKLYNLVIENQKLLIGNCEKLNSTNQKQIDIMGSFFTKLEEKIKVTDPPRLPGDEWKDI
jgi:hypothetical protein